MIPSGNNNSSSDEPEVSSSENKKREKTSKYTGVWWDSSKRKWVSTASHAYEKIWVGNYHQEDVAALAYDAALVCLCESDPDVLRRLNFPETPPKIQKKEGKPFTSDEIRKLARKHINDTRENLLSTETPPDSPSKEGQPFSPKEIEEQARNHTNWQTTGPIEAAADTTEQCDKNPTDIGDGGYPTAD